MNQYTLATLENFRRMPHEHAFLDERKLREDTILGAKEPRELLAWNFAGIFPQDHRAFVSQIIFANAINFQFASSVQRSGGMMRFETQTVDGQIAKGSMGMSACFYRLQQERPLHVHDLFPHIRTSERMARFFAGSMPLPALEDRRRLLQEVCDVLQERYDGDPWNVWEEGRFHAYGEGNARGVVDILTQDFPQSYGSDVHVFRTSEGELLTFHFHKKPHLSLFMYQARAEHSEGVLPLIPDIGEVGPMPEYILQRAYTTDGTIRLSEEFAHVINQGIPIVRGSQMELEIRGLVAQAVVRETQVRNEERALLELPSEHIGYTDVFRYGQARGGKHYLCDTTDY